MEAPTITRNFDCTIVGGGIHGTYLTQRLLEDPGFDRTDLRIIDPHDRLLTSFREKAATCGMDSLRSTFVHHIGTEPFGLESFAEGNDRANELIPTVNYPPRPSLDLFLDYSDYVISRHELESLHLQASVEAIHNCPGGEGLRLETTAGPIDTNHCILAIGHGDRYRRPDWAVGLDRVEHVWGQFDHEASVEHTIVVGGGITAMQLACALCETEMVTLVSRHPLEWELSEADPRWINWSYIETTLHGHPPGSKEQLEVVADACYTATVPPFLSAEFADRRTSGALAVVHGDVSSVVDDGETVRVALKGGSTFLGDRVVLATGFESIFDHPFVDRIAERLDLARGYQGMPVLDDDRLVWQSNDGRFVPLYVTGALALGTVGPYAPNIPGARRASDRITTAITRRGCRPASERPGNRNHGPEVSTNLHSPPQS